MFSSATQPPRPPQPRHNFVVSAITFEGFKLRSSNLTHPNISDKFDNGHCRPKVICGHPKWPPAAILSKIKKTFSSVWI